MAETILVTGAGGFLGSYIVEDLLAHGYDVRALVRTPNKALDDKPIEVLHGDLTDPAYLENAVQGVDAIIHVAAKAGGQLDWQSFYQSNVLATRLLLEAAGRAGVGRFVYTSSPSVIFKKGGLCGADESEPYPAQWLCPYMQTKAIAEKLVLASNGLHNLKTCALRPHIICGRGDRHIIPKVLQRARAKKLIQVGDAANLVDLTHVRNAALAHRLALEALKSSPDVQGEAFFITDGHPINLYSWTAKLLKHAKLPSVTKRIPFKMAYGLGMIAEFVYRALRLKDEPRVSRFIACQLAEPHYFIIQKAQKNLAYTSQFEAHGCFSELLD